MSVVMVVVVVVVVVVMMVAVTPMPPLMVMMVVVMMVVLRQFYCRPLIGRQTEVAVSPLGFQPRDRVGNWIEEFRIGLSGSQRRGGGSAGGGCAKSQG